MASDTLTNPPQAEQRLDFLNRLARLAGTQTCQDYRTLLEPEPAPNSLEDINGQNVPQHSGKLSCRILQQIRQYHRH